MLGNPSVGLYTQSPLLYEGFISSFLNLKTKIYKFKYPGKFISPGLKDGSLIGRKQPVTHIRPD